jgi:hypothetical protein
MWLLTDLLGNQHWKRVSVSQAAAEWHLQQRLTQWPLKANRHSQSSLQKTRLVHYPVLTYLVLH